MAKNDGSTKENYRGPSNNTERVSVRTDDRENTNWANWGKKRRLFEITKQSARKRRAKRNNLKFDWRKEYKRSITEYYECQNQ